MIIAFIFRIESHIREFVYSFFNFMFDIEFELLNFRNWIVLLMIVFLKVCPLFRGNLKHCCIVTCCCCLDIIVNIEKFFVAFHIVNIYYSEEVDEHRKASYTESSYFSMIFSFLWHIASNLNEKVNMLFFSTKTLSWRIFLIET